MADIANTTTSIQPVLKDTYSDSKKERFSSLKKKLKKEK